MLRNSISGFNFAGLSASRIRKSHARSKQSDDGYPNKLRHDQPPVSKMSAFPNEVKADQFPYKTSRFISDGSSFLAGPCSLTKPAP